MTLEKIYKLLSQTYELLALMKFDRNVILENS